MRSTLFVLAACTSTPATDDIVTTTRGDVRGTRDGDVRAWLGVPYAAPPVGDLRFRVPQPMPAWEGVRDARSWASSCIEITTAGTLIGGSEDCLYLNVWAPADAEHLPVLFFIHGGFNLSGSASHILAGERIYDGTYIAAHGPAVVVTINYRLGALGFFTHEGAPGNFAHHDQLAALQWVHDNIAAFGGDPARVMVFGESAGGAATCTLFASPRAKGLLAAALVESAACFARDNEAPAELTRTLVAAVGCATAPDVLACVRAVPADRIATAASIDLATDFARWGAIVDGDIVPEPPAAAIAAGRHNRVPLIIGSTSNEYSTLVRNFQRAPITTEAEYREAVARFFPNFVDVVLARYPITTSPQQTLITLLGDAFMTCPTRRAARAASAFGSVRRYLFDHTYESGSYAALGAGHAMDLPFEFHNLDLAGFTPSPGELALSDAIIGYWVRFAATGDPNGASTEWPAYDASDPTIVLDNVVTSRRGIRTTECDFWDR